MVGLMCKNNSVFYSVKSSHDSIDGIGSHYSQIFRYGPESDHKLVFDFIWTRHVLTNASMRPIHDWVIGHEYVQISKPRRLCSTIDS